MLLPQGICRGQRGGGDGARGSAGAGLLCGGARLGGDGGGRRRLRRLLVADDDPLGDAALKRGCPWWSRPALLEGVPFVGIDDERFAREWLSTAGAGSPEVRSRSVPLLRRRGTGLRRRGRRDYADPPGDPKRLRGDGGGLEPPAALEGVPVYECYGKLGGSSAARGPTPALTGSPPNGDLVSDGSLGAIEAATRRGLSVPKTSRSRFDDVPEAAARDSVPYDGQPGPRREGRSWRDGAGRAAPRGGDGGRGLSCPRSCGTRLDWPPRLTRVNANQHRARKGKKTGNRPAAILLEPVVLYYLALPCIRLRCILG